MKAKWLPITVAVLLAGVATAVLALYLQGLEDGAADGPPTIGVVVADQDIPVGTALAPLVDENAFTVRQVPEDLVVPGALTDVDQLLGRQASSALVAGEQVSQGRLEGQQQVQGGILGIPEGLEAVSIRLEDQRLAGGQLLRGDFVKVYGSFDRSGAETTIVLVPDARVLEVVKTEAGGTASPSASLGILATLALTPPDALEVVFAQEHGTVWLSLLPPDGATDRGRSASLSLDEVTR